MVEPRLEGADLQLGERQTGGLARGVAQLGGGLLSDPISLMPAVGLLQQLRGLLTPERIGGGTTSPRGGFLNGLAQLVQATVCFTLGF